ncbi:hypothetical protein LXA43DRAFT_1030533 [Ganoderma leucocontextum]|nr:hypothetical protein LXA43DRAFT_1030533 [Ganoderma leucocontextum]
MILRACRSEPVASMVFFVHIPQPAVAQVINRRTRDERREPPLNSVLKHYRSAFCDVQTLQFDVPLQCSTEGPTGDGCNPP